MLSNGDELAAGARQQQPQPQPSQQQPTVSAGMARSKDDAMVAYLFQRPQAEAEQFTGKRWPMGDDMVMEQVRTNKSIRRSQLHSNTSSMMIVA